VSALAAQDIIGGYAGLAGIEPPDVSRESALGIAVAECHLIGEALKAGATWAQVGAVRGETGAFAKRRHHLLGREVRKALALRANAN
jgi:hypothetical protein